MSRRLIERRFTTGGLVLATVMAAMTLISSPARAQQQDELTRKVKFKTAPTYPEVARRMNIAGVVKIEVVVAPNGTLKTTKVVGGHPLLASAALDAIKKWKFESAPEESSGIVEFKFEHQD